MKTVFLTIVFVSNVETEKSIKVANWLNTKIRYPGISTAISNVQLF